MTFHHPLPGGDENHPEKPARILGIHSKLQGKLVAYPNALLQVLTDSSRSQRLV